MGHDARALISAAALQTMCGAAHVTLSFGMSVPECDTTAEYVGVVDFGADRCRLDQQPYEGVEAMAFEGPVSYMRQADGRWTWTKGAAGTRSMFDPRWVLEALVHAPKSARATAGHAVEVALDYETLNAGTDIGLSPDWDESTALVRLSPSGRITRTTLTHRSHEHPDAWMRCAYQITETCGQVTVELPRHEAAIPLEQYVDEQMNGEHDA